MDMKEHLEKQRKNWPIAQWTFLRMEIEGIFPAPNLFHESMWGSWLSKIKEGEKNDDEFLAKRQKAFEQLLSSGENCEYDIDPGEMLADEAYESFTLTNNICAALVVSIWSKSEMSLKKISSLSAVQLERPTPAYRYDCQKCFFAGLGIKFESLPGAAAVNGIRLLNNIYKHAEGRCSESNFNKFTAQVAKAWGVQCEKNIEYSLPSHRNCDELTRWPVM